MQKLNVADLLPLEQYARQRNDLRTRVLEHKKNRRLAIGPNVTWCFEDRLTIQYQIQEMLRVERIFEPEGITSELDAYNPLIPDGRNWKVTFLVEFPNEDERRTRLVALKGIEDHCWIQVQDFARVPAIADEDMERSNDDKTAAVHFLRFELSDAMIGALRSGARLAAGISHLAYSHAVEPVAEAVRLALSSDLEGTGSK